MSLAGFDIASRHGVSGEVLEHLARAREDLRRAAEDARLALGACNDESASAQIEEATQLLEEDGELHDLLTLDERTWGEDASPDPRAIRDSL